MAITNDSAAEAKQMVGPIIRDAELAEAVIAAVEMDNEGVDVMVEERSAYTRIHTSRTCRITRQSVEEALGRPFQITDLEPELSSFAGRMKYVGDDEVVFYLEREE